MKKFLLFGIVPLLFGCIGEDIIDDYVEPRLIITNPIMELRVGDTYQLETQYFDSVGRTADAEVIWQSASPNIVSVTAGGQLEAIEAGAAVITGYNANDMKAMTEMVVEAGGETIVVETGVKGGTIATTSTYVLEGGFTISNQDNGGVLIEVKSDYQASTALPGLYVYLSNNPSTVNGAYEIGAVQVFSGAHNYSITDENINVNSYQYLLYFCKPFNVKVGHGEITDQ